MRRLADADLPIRRRKTFTSEVREIYRRQGLDDKVALLIRGHGCTATSTLSTGWRATSTVRSHPPRATSPSSTSNPATTASAWRCRCARRPTASTPACTRRRCRTSSREYQRWVNIMGVPTVGDVNSKVLAGDAGGMIKLAEAFHERKLAEMADAILEANAVRGVRTVLISGPSSSGKTTSAKRLGIHLGVLGLKPVLISLDDYFVEREKDPARRKRRLRLRGARSHRPEALQRPPAPPHAGRERGYSALRLHHRQAAVAPHAPHASTNARSSSSRASTASTRGSRPRFPDRHKFRIYVSCFTSVAMDNMSRIATTDNRLLRRLTRDYTQRAPTPWPRSGAGPASAAARSATSSPTRKTPT